MCARGAVVKIVFNVDYLNLHTRDLTNVLVFLEVYNILAEVGGDDVEKTSWLHSIIPFAIIQLDPMIIFFSVTTFFKSAACVDTSTNISDMAFKTSFRATVIEFWFALLKRYQ